ncbi:phosphatidylserine decarboxylase [Methylocucumis oryzae]
MEKGQEFGRFNMGSTIIMLLADDNKASWGEEVQPGNSVKQGESIGRYY